MTPPASDGSTGRPRSHGAPLFAMNPKQRPECPHCGCALVPVHRLQDGRRTVVAFTCPEPFCAHHLNVDAASGPLPTPRSFSPR